MVEVESVSGIVAGDMVGLNIDLPVACRVGKINGVVVASGGLAWGGGRCWLWFHVNDGVNGILRPAMRHAKAMFLKAAQLGETEVYTTRDASYETSERLLKLAGFEKTDEILDGQEVWRHSVS